MKDGLGAPQSVLVLGGTSEIALATVRALMQQRVDRVVLAGRNPTALSEAATGLRANGSGRTVAVDTVHFEAEDTSSHRDFVDSTFDRWRDFDVVIVAVGILGDQEIAERDPDVAMDVLRTNFVGTASAGLHVARRLRVQGHGTLVVLSSVAAERARRANFVYGSSKAGMDAFFSGLGDSLVGSGARVLVIRPGFVFTRATDGLKPAPLATTPERVGAITAAAIASGAEEAWAPGALRWVMCVVRHLPRPLFRRLNF